MLRKYTKFVPILVMIAMLTTACESYRNVGPSQAAGGVIGAVGGGLAGSQIGSGSGRVVGAAVGTGLGYVVGSEVGARVDASRGYRPYPYGSTYYYRDPFYYRY